MSCAVIGLLLLLAVIGWLMVSGLRLRQLAQGPWIVCASCGHALVHGQSRCPECGQQWDAQAVERLRAARSRGGTMRLWVSAVLLGLVLAAVGVSLWHALLEP
jgi:predicted RNA-binding Zn-ribbon protein involved in translation (DUF1610 family)